MTISDHSGVTKFSKVELTPLDKNSSICNTLDFDGSYLHRLFQCDLICMLFDPRPFSTSVCLYSVLIQLDYTTTTYPLAVTPWSGVTECLDPSTIWPTGQESWRFLFLRQQGVVISTYYTYWYTSDTSILFYLTRNTCKFLQ